MNELYVTQFSGELEPVQPPAPTLPAGQYRVVAGTLYRIVPGIPPQFAEPQEGSRP